MAYNSKEEIERGFHSMMFYIAKGIANDLGNDVNVEIQVMVNEENWIGVCATSDISDAKRAGSNPDAKSGVCCSPK